MSATDHTAPKPDLRDAWPAAIAVLLLAAALLHMATYWYYTVEDAYISFRYAENFARGQGLTYNPGERIEGFSNLLWVLILGGTAASGCDELPLAAKVIGASAGLAVIAVTVWIAWLLLPVARWLALVPGIMLAVNPSFAVWSQAGLETPLYTLWLILACVPLVTATPGWRHGVISGLLWGMALATRPEAPLYLLAVCLPLVFHRRQTWRLLTGLAVGFMAVALPVEVFRIGYFGDVVPNTYHVKSTRFQGGGWRYLLTSLRMTGIGPLAVAPFAPLLRHRARWAGWSCLLAMSLPAAYIVRQGGDWMPMARFFVPVLPFLALAAAMGIAAMLSWTRPWGQRLASCLGVGLAVLLLGVLVRIAYLGDEARKLDVTAGEWGIGLAAALLAAGAVAAVSCTARGAAWLRRGKPVAVLVIVALSAVISLTAARHDVLGWEAQLHRQWQAVGLWLRDNARAGETMATGLGGIIPYYAGLPNYDNGGLMDRRIAMMIRQAPDVETERERVDRFIMGEYRPAYFLLPNLVQLWPPGQEQTALAPWRLASDPEFTAKYRLRQVEIGNKVFYFFKRIGRSDLEVRSDKHRVMAPAAPLLAR